MKLVRKLGIATGALLVCLLIVALIAVFFINSVARSAVEAGGSYALGVPVSVSGIDIGLVRGSVQIDGLRVANAPDFPGEHFLKLGKGRVNVSLASLAGDTVQVPLLALDDLDLRLERRDGRANYDAILANLEKLSGPRTDPAPPEPTGSDKRLVIHELTLRNINVHADLVEAPGVLGEAARVTVPISEIRLTNVGRTGEGVAGSGVTVGELAGLVVQAILAAAVERGGLPADLTRDLQGHLANLGDLAGGAGKKVADQVHATVGKLGEQVGGEVQKGAEQLGTELQKQTDRLKGLIPGSRDDKK